MTDLSITDWCEPGKAWINCPTVRDLSFRSVNKFDVVQTSWKAIWDFFS